MTIAERIENASPLELTVITHEILLERIDAAIKAAPRSQECEDALDKARDCVASLYETLNMEIEFSGDLADLYLYVNGVLINAGVIREMDAKNSELSSVRRIIAELSEAWQALFDDPDLPNKLKAEAENPQIFAGLTYGADGQLTEFQDFDPDGGYKV
ncbi:MAG: flagellar protein FliS [Defluviitaleaceae bacterium]|nr:flagellar protein FliS [Defluviitaleaceae bacterium]